jgi:hypothetical protein
LAELRGLAVVESLVTLGGGSYDLRSPAPREAAAAVTQLLRAQGPQVNLLRLGRSSLEEIFLQLTDGPA